MNERLTREEVERCRTLLYDAAPRYKELQALCDLALSALDREEPPMTNDELADEIEQAIAENNGDGWYVIRNDDGEADQIIAALRRSQPSGEIVMVPREPTADMVIAGNTALHRRVSLDVAEAYRAMLSAAEAKDKP